MKKPNTDSEDAWIRGADDRNCQTCKNTTIGGVPGPIGAGTWKIVIYLFAEYIEQTLEGVSLPFRIQISDRKTEIQETIGKCLWVDRHYREQLWLGYYNKSSFYSSRGRWYKGDFHTHTHLSDGKESVSSAMRKARMMDLDFYVPTEHNIIPTGWEDDYMLILPGVEITTKIGHCNLIGIDKMPERLPEIMEYADTPEVEEYLYEILREAKNGNGSSVLIIRFLRSGNGNMAKWDWTILLVLKL